MLTDSSSVSRGVGFLLSSGLFDHPSMFNTSTLKISFCIFIAFIDYKTIPSFKGGAFFDSLIVSHSESYVKFPSYNILYNRKQPFH